MKITRKITNGQIRRFHRFLDKLDLGLLKSAKYNINHRIQMKKLKEKNNI